MQVSGPAVLQGGFKQYGMGAGASRITVIPDKNAGNKSEVMIVVQTKPLSWQSKGGVCWATVVIECEECECAGATPTVVVGASELAPGNSTTAYVNSGGLACGPFAWSISGTGFTISPSSTDGDGETVTVTAGAAACGSAAVTATDYCGVSSTAYVRCTVGVWNTKETCNYLATDRICANPNPGHGPICPVSRTITAGNQQWLLENAHYWVMSGCYGGYCCTGTVAWNCLNPPPCGSPIGCYTADTTGHTCFVGCTDNDPNNSFCGYTKNTYAEWECP